jgi:hypothetical protein
VSGKAVLKISILDTLSHRRLVVEGKLVAPWAALLRSVWQKATADLHGRELVREGVWFLSCFSACFFR